VYGCVTLSRAIINGWKKEIAQPVDSGVALLHRATPKAFKSTLLTDRPELGI